MANKKSTKKVNEDAQAKKMVKKAVKKATKNKSVRIAIAIIAAVIIITIVAVYVIKPELITTAVDKIVALVKGENQGQADGEIHEGLLTVHYINVGQGDCIYIQLPDNKDMIIDCANYNNSSTYMDSTFEYLDTLITDGTIDYLMLTHCDSDHVYFLDDVVKQYQINNIYMPNVLASHSSVSSAGISSEKLAKFTDKDKVDTACYANFFIAALIEPNCTVRLNIGDFTITGENYTFDFYCYDQQDWDDTDLSSAEEKNAISPVGILSYNNRRLVFTGDSNEINEPKVMDKIGGSLYDCDVLKVGHHGSDTSSTTAFLNFVKCEYAVISCNAAGNTFSHPRQSTLDRLSAQS